MTTYVCSECGSEFNSKKELRACIFKHLETQYDEVKGPEPIVEEAVEPESEYYVHKPVVVQAYKSEVEKEVETLNGSVTVRPGEWIITGAMGEQYPCDPKVFENSYDKCDGEFAPVIIPRRLCPTEIQYLGTNQVLMVRVNGMLTTDFDIVVNSVDFIRR